MPPYLAIPYFHLSKLPISTKIMLSLFLLSVAAAILFVGITFYPSRTTEEEEGIKNFVQDEDQSLLGLKADFAKHQIADSSDEMKKGMKEADLKHAYLTVHPHTFLMPVIYFILCHLCEMATLAVRFKLFLYSAAFAGMMFSIFAPILIYTSIKFALICHLSFYLMLLCYLVMILNTFIQLWNKPSQ